MPDWHIVVGFASLAGMAFHFMLAFIAGMVRRAEAINRLFHRGSLTIYTSWLIAFCNGTVAGIIGK